MYVENGGPRLSCPLHDQSYTAGPSAWCARKRRNFCLVCPKPCSWGVQLERAGLIDAEKDGKGMKGVEDQEMLMAIMDARELIEGTQVRIKGFGFAIAGLSSCTECTSIVLACFRASQRASEHAPVGSHKSRVWRFSETMPRALFVIHTPNGWAKSDFNKGCHFACSGNAAFGRTVIHRSFSGSAEAFNLCAKFMRHGCLRRTLMRCRSFEWTTEQRQSTKCRCALAI